MLKRILPLALLALSSGAAWAGPGDITIEKPWARETPPGAMSGAAYVTLSNTGTETDRLLGYTGDAAKMLELHTVTMTDGVMKMRPVEVIELPAGESVMLKPGGFHMMLMGLNGPMKEGEMVKFVLSFEQAGEVEVEFPVKKMKGGMKKDSMN